jgi:hypothetical protein
MPVTARAFRSESDATSNEGKPECDLLQPFPNPEYIDVKRAAHILGVSHTNILELHAARRIEMINYAKHKRKRIRYASIVEFCDRLRLDHGIANRRPALPSSLFRHRDEDVLPFPLADTLSTTQALQYMAYDSTNPILHMIDEGLFEAYKISNSSAWRISAISLAAFLRAVQKRPNAASDQIGPRSKSRYL